MRIDLNSHEVFLSQELSWLAFARRVISMAERRDLPLLERVHFAGIAGMLHDEFFMKRISGLKRKVLKKSTKLSIDGRSAAEELAACRDEILDQDRCLAQLVNDDIRPALVEAGTPIFDYEELRKKQAADVRRYLIDAVKPILTPLAIDSEHPFPFISNFGVNLAVVLGKPDGKTARFLRIKVPSNRPRWVPVPGGGWVPLEQVLAANLDVISPSIDIEDVHLFRVTRGAQGEVDRSGELIDDPSLPDPGSILRQVSSELKARKFAGTVRLQVDPSTPKKIRKWLAKQLDVEPTDVYPSATFLGVRDLVNLEVEGRDELRFPSHSPVTPPRLATLTRPLASPEGFYSPGSRSPESKSAEPRSGAVLPEGADGVGALFAEIARGDLLVHHPYQSFDDSVLRFIEAAALDPKVLAIKLTIYRTSADSPIVRALAEAARRGKQVAVLVEITARFDEAPNIAWGEYLESEGVHVAYGVESLKTHVKLALVVREENEVIHRYAHVGTGNYHSGNALLYEDLGVLTADPQVCNDVSKVFDTLTAATEDATFERLLVAPKTMRRRFTEMIVREAKHAKAGRPSGIDAKMNQLQDPALIRELYRASRAGVPIRLNVRGLCCLRPQVPGLSENIQVFSILGRFLEHSRIFRFENGGSPEHYIGSADWMRRNLDRRVETVLEVTDPNLKTELDTILKTYCEDNSSAWDCDGDGVYTMRTPKAGEERRAAQERFVETAEAERIVEPPITLVPRSA